MRARYRLCVGAVAVALGCCSTALAQTADHGHAELESEFEQSSAPPPRDVLALAGFGMFGVAYTNSVFAALLSDRSTDHRLYIPVAGPWLALAQRDCSAQPCSLAWLSGTLFVVDGVAQGAGAALMIASLFVPDKPADGRVGSARVSLTPARLAPGAYGLQAAGNF